MPQTLIKTTSFDFPPAVVLATLTGAEFLEQSAKAREGVVDATYVELLRSEDRLVFELHTTQQARGMWGVRRSRTEVSVRRAEWDLRTMRCEWTVKSEHARLFTFQGVTQIEPRGDDRCDVTYEYVLHIHFPIFGGAIERLVMREFDAAQQPFDDHLRSYCESHAAA